jgi:anti-sigma factor RsiW
MDENLQEDWLDARLREESAYIDDAGFTARVVQKLPAHRVRHSLRAVILLGGTLVASAIAYLLSGGGWFIADGVTRFALLPLPLLWLCAAGATVLVMAGGLAAAMSKTGWRLR